VLVAAVPVTALLQALVDHAPLQPAGLVLIVAGCALAVAATPTRRRVSAPG